MSNLRNYIFESAQNAYDDVNEEQMFEEMSISEQMFEVYEDNLQELAPLLATGTKRFAKKALSGIANSKLDNVSRPKIFKKAGGGAMRNTFKKQANFGTIGKKQAKPFGTIGRRASRSGRPMRFGSSGRTR